MPSGSQLSRVERAGSNTYTGTRRRPDPHPANRSSCCPDGGTDRASGRSSGAHEDASASTGRPGSRAAFYEHEGGIQPTGGRGILAGACQRYAHPLPQDRADQ